ncbi:hypothetical protein I553_8194 [Mycobacterium xenopi 4042]|uniref:Uncharacterized protein n=1 Tax=Mycobacterium xenopi 4042 TaxID=1299334 RepID=X8DCX1_MYCXE|nr:hypothetical protein I553_8194 [Mycobacterium xenopi 4042]
MGVDDPGDRQRWAPSHRSPPTEFCSAYASRCGWRWSA